MRRVTRLVGLVVVVCAIGMASPTVVDTVAADAPTCGEVTYGGSGTASDPYKIENVSQLQCIEEDLDAHYELVSDVDASDTQSWNEGKGFDPIGGDDDGLAGTIDGRGHTIADIYINATESDKRDIGVISKTETGATIKNINIVNASIISDTGYTGILIGWLVEDSTMSKTSATGTIISTADGPTYYIGGLGSAIYGQTNNSYARVNIRHTVPDVDGTIGGLAANAKGTTKISESYAVSNVSVENESTEIYGITRQAPVFDNSPEVNRTYWDKEFVENADSTYGTGLSTDKMTGETAKDNLDGFDFTSTWKVVDGDYPILRFNVAPKDLSVSDSSVSQSDGVDAVVGTLTAEDPDGDTLSYSLINGNGDDDNGKFFIDDTELRADDASTMPAGDYSVRVEAADGKGGTTENALTVTVVDDLPPQLTVTVTDNTDGDGTLAAGEEVQIKADVTDVTDVDTVIADASAFDAGHQVDLSHDTGTTYKESVTVGQNPSQGTQSVTVTATDTKDNEASVTGGQLTVDTNPPDITGVTISDDDGNDVLADGDDLTIEAEVTDATTVDTVTADVSAFDEGEISLSSTQGDTYSKTITLDGSLEEGAQSVTVSATDDLGNGGGQDSNSNELTVDTTPPSITSVTITDATDSNGILADGDKLTLEAEVTDANTIDTVKANAAAYDAGTVTLTHAEGDTYDTTMAIGANPTEGNQSVTVSATDSAGNGGGQASASNNALTVDLTPPATADDAGTGNEDENGTTLVDDIRTNDEDGVSADSDLEVTKVDGDTNNVGEAVAGTDGGQFTITAEGEVTFDADGDFESLNNGDTDQTSVAVTVADEAGNENTSTVTATVEGVNDDPTNLSVDNATVRQSAGVNATVGTLSAEDVDNDVANLTYTLVAGTGDANNSAFRIDGDDLQARNASTMADGEYDVRVGVEDPDGGTTEEPFTVRVVDDVAPIVGPVTLTDATDGNGILAAGDDLTITATVTDVTAVNAVSANASAFDNATVTLEETATDTYEATVTVGNDPAEFDQSVTVNATDTLDNGGDQATVSESIVVDTTPPTTRDDTGRASEDTTGTRLIADVRASNTDAVSAATDLVVTAVDGNESVVDAPVTGTNGGRFTVSADGRVLFDGNADFESLYTGETDRTSISVTIADEAGNEATQTVTAVVDGVTDETGAGGSSASIKRAPSSSPAQTSTVSLQDVYGGQRIVVDFAREQVTTSVVPTSDASAALGRAQASVPAGDIRNVQSDGLALTVADRGDYDLTVTARDVDVFARNTRSTATDAPTNTDDVASDGDPAGDVASSDADLSTDALGEESRQFVEATARRPVGFITVDHSFEPDDLETATHRFRVRKSYLAATGATAESATLYRDGPAGYRDLPTREVDADETFHYFEAETPGFSTFVIGTDAPVFDLGDPALVTADETSGRVEATVPVENVGTHAGTYTARLRGDGTVLATTTVSVPPGETVTARVQTTLPDADGVTLSLAGRSLDTVSSGGQETVAEADEEPSDSSSPLVAVGIVLLVFIVLAVVILGTWRRTEPADESTDDADDESTDDADDESTDYVTVDPATETPPAATDEPAPDGPERAASEAVSDTPDGHAGRPDTERATDDQYSGELDTGASDTTAPTGTTDATRSTATEDSSAESADTASEERPPSETDESSEER